MLDVTRVCKLCEEEKPLDGFEPTSSGVRRGTCKTCRAQYKYGQRCGSNEEPSVKLPWAPEGTADSFVWKQRAACRTAAIGLSADGETTDGSDPADRSRAWYYSGDMSWGSGSAKLENHERALAGICASCPVLMECRALARVEPFGYMAGLPERMRKSALMRAEVE